MTNNKKNVVMEEHEDLRTNSFEEGRNDGNPLTMAKCIHVDKFHCGRSCMKRSENDGAPCTDWESRSFIGAMKFGVEARLKALSNGMVWWR